MSATHVAWAPRMISTGPAGAGAGDERIWAYASRPRTQFAMRMRQLASTG